MNEIVEHKLREFFSKFKFKKLEKEEYLIRAGKDPEGVIYLIEGTVREVITTKKGEELTLNLFKPYAFLPLTWAIDNIPNKYDFIAMTDVAFYIAPKNETVNFLQHEPAVMYDLIQRLLSGISGMLAKDEQLMGRSARTRLILTLLQLAYRYGTTIPFHLAHRDLASLSGLTRETISHELKHLEAEGFVVTEHKITHVKNIEQLEELLQTT